VRQLLHFLLFIFLLSADRVCAQLYTFRKYDHRDGLLTSSTLCSAQDEKGYLWVGSDGGGLMRFDGKKFSAVGPAGKSYRYHVSSICPLRDGSVLFSALYDGIYRYSKGKYDLVFKANADEGEYLFAQQQDNHIICVTAKSVFLVTKKGEILRRYRLGSSPDMKLVQTLRIPQGLLLFTTQGNLLVRNGTIQPLSARFPNPLHKGFAARFATFSDNTLTLYDGQLRNKLVTVFTTNGEVLSAREETCAWTSPIDADDPIIIARDAKGGAYFVTKKNRIFQLKHNIVSPITQNHGTSLIETYGLSLDRNDDIWLTTLHGLFKISKEPFTQIDLDPLFHSQNITFIYKSVDDKLFLGEAGSGTTIWDLDANRRVAHLDIEPRSWCEQDGKLFLATRKGIYRIDGLKALPADFPFSQNQSVSLIHFDGSAFWYSPMGKGLVRYDPAAKSVQTFRDLGPDFPDYYYTAQTSADGQHSYFGSNSGIMDYDHATGRIRRMDAFRHLGAYGGNTAKDKFGTLWFTLDKGLAGILRTGELVTIEGDSYFPSTLFYTLTSDNFGNLLVGTNLGINVIKVDRQGRVKHNRNYGSSDGFGGYETNMRSQYVFGNYSFVGTIEGLYLLNSEVLSQMPVPPAPLVLSGRENSLGELVRSAEKNYYTFKCLLSKYTTTLYSYRIAGYSDKWSGFSKNFELELPDLPNGNYMLEVRSSYDGINHSKTTRFPILISVPIWKTKWFVVVIIVFLGIINLGYLEWTKSFLSSNIFTTKDTSPDNRFVSRILLFVFIANSAMLIVANVVEPEVFHTRLINIVFSSALLALFGFSFVSRRDTSSSRTGIVLFLLAYLTIVVESFLLLLLTRLHPLPVFILTVATSLLPFVVTRIQLVITITLTQLIAASLILIWIDEARFNEILYISTIAVSGGIAVMINYLRNDSLEKLIFASGVINRGNVMVISFDRRGIVNYCSENISDHLNIDFTSIVGQHTSILNPFIVTSEMRQMDIRDIFEDGKVIEIPMYDRQGKVIWIEWSCKTLNASVRVIMGHDITEKVNLSTNYQVLVENAEDMIYYTDINAKFLFANERSVQLFGYRNDSIIGKYSLQLVAPEYREAVSKFYTDQFVNRIHHTYLEFPIKPRDGRVFWVGQNATLLYEPGSRKRISGYLIVARNITEKRANDLLIEQQNKDITASINYAKRIQFNLLPHRDSLLGHFSEVFVFYKPKDIVSGDFYWTEEIDGKLLVVLADCTGHGVPGAFMTLLGINLLNQIVRERKITDPAQILYQLSTELSRILPPHEGVVMYDDVEALVALFDDGEVTFASSGVSCLHASEGRLTLHRPEGRFGRSAENSMQFGNERISLREGDVFYMFTDGYQSQFGSIRNKKFSYKRMLELLEKIQVESLALQKKYFENALRNWSEGHEQTDDITVIGLKK
jgi:PAS domain S-box-containing protein